MIAQVFIFICGASAIWLVGRTGDWKRWGYIMGLAGQPFWIFVTVTNQQWGIFALCLFYTYSWGQGVWNYWIKPPDGDSMMPKRGGAERFKKPWEDSYYHYWEDR